jgi:hypothetical protein
MDTTATHLDPKLGSADAAAKPAPRSRAGVTRRQLFAAGILAAVIVVLAAVLYVWQRLEDASSSASATVDRARGETSVAMAKLAAAEHRHVAALGDQLQARADRLLVLSAAPLAWAVREPLGRQDLATIATYFRELAREPMVRRVALVAPDGAVQVASDPDLEGRPATELFGAVDLAADEPRTTTTPGGVVLTAPVLGVTERLGTVVLVAEPAAGARR